MTGRWLILIALLAAALGAPHTSHAQGQTPINSYTAVQLGDLGGGGTTACGLNDGRQVVGQSYTAVINGAQYRRAFLWQAGAMYDLGTLGGGASTARGINNSG